MQNDQQVPLEKDLDKIRQRVIYHFKHVCSEKQDFNVLYNGLFCNCVSFDLAEVCDTLVEEGILQKDFLPDEYTGGSIEAFAPGCNFPHDTLQPSYKSLQDLIPLETIHKLLKEKRLLHFPSPEDYYFDCITFIFEGKKNGSFKVVVSPVGISGTYTSLKFIKILPVYEYKYVVYRPETLLETITENYYASEEELLAQYCPLDSTGFRFQRIDFMRREREELCI